MRLNELRNQSYEIAKSKGWHDADAPRATFDDRIALMISEASEALEEYRKGIGPKVIYFPLVEQMNVSDEPETDTYRSLKGKSPIALAEMGFKPEGIGIEIADIVIRIGDAAGAYDLDLEEAAGNGLRSISDMMETPTGHSPNGSASFGTWFCAVSRRLLDAAAAWEKQSGFSAAIHMDEALWIVCQWCVHLGVELQSCIDIKSAFNRTRPHRHGNKVL